MDLKEIERYFGRRKHHLSKEEYRAVMAALRKLERAEKSFNAELAEEIKIKGNEEYRSGDFQAAVDSYTQAIVYDPLNPIHLSNRAAAYAKLGMVENAIEDCEKGLEIDDQFVKLYTRLGTLYLGKNKEKALQVFKRGLEVDPENKTLKRQVELIIKDVPAQASSPKEQDFLDDMVERMGMGGIKDGGIDFNSLLGNKNIKDILNTVMKDKSPQDLMDMVRSVIGGVERPTDKN